MCFGATTERDRGEFRQRVRTQRILQVEIVLGVKLLYRATRTKKKSTFNVNDNHGNGFVTGKAA